MFQGMDDFTRQGYYPQYGGQQSQAQANPRFSQLDMSAGMEMEYSDDLAPNEELAGFFRNTIHGARQHISADSPGIDVQPPFYSNTENFAANQHYAPRSTPSTNTMLTVARQTYRTIIPGLRVHRDTGGGPIAVPHPPMQFIPTALPNMSTDGAADEFEADENRNDNGGDDDRGPEEDDDIGNGEDDNGGDREDDDGGDKKGGGSGGKKGRGSGGKKGGSSGGKKDGGKKPKPGETLEWWRIHHTKSGKFAIVKKYLTFIEAHLVDTAFPSFAKTPTNNAIMQTFMSRAQVFCEAPPTLSIEIQDVRRLTTVQAGQMRERHFPVVRAVLLENWSFHVGMWASLTSPQRAHNSRMKYDLIDAYGCPLLHVVNDGKVTGYFKAPGYLQALDEMLPVVGHLMESSDGFMSRSYYSYVGMHYIRGAISFESGAEVVPTFLKEEFNPSFESLLADTAKHLIGPFWDNHRQTLHRSSRQDPPKYMTPRFPPTFSPPPFDPDIFDPAFFNPGAIFN